MIATMTKNCVDCEDHTACCNSYLAAGYEQPEQPHYFVIELKEEKPQPKNRKQSPLFQKMQRQKWNDVSRRAR